MTHDENQFQTVLAYLLGETKASCRIYAEQHGLPVELVTDSVGKLLQAGSAWRSSGVKDNLPHVRSGAPRMAEGSAEVAVVKRSHRDRPRIKCDECDREIGTTGLHKHLLVHGHSQSRARTIARRLRMGAA